MTTFFIRSLRLASCYEAPSIRRALQSGEHVHVHVPHLSLEHAEDSGVLPRYEHLERFADHGSGCFAHLRILSHREHLEPRLLEHTPDNAFRCKAEMIRQI